MYDTFQVEKDDSNSSAAGDFSMNLGKGLDLSGS